MPAIIGFNPVSLLLSVPAMISGSLAIYSLTRQSVLGSRVFTLLMLAACEWSIFEGICLSCLTVECIMVCSTFEYLAIASIPVLLLILALLYTGREHWVTPRNMALLFVIPAITVVMVATNQWHNFYYASVSLNPGHPFPELALTRGPWFWVHVVYSYGALTLATLILIVRVSKASPIFRFQVIAMLAGLGVPWAVSVLYVVFGMKILGYVDPTAFGFTITGMIFAWGMFRHGLFDILPVEFETVADSTEDAIAVLDWRQRLVMCNRAARRTYGFTQSDIGKTAPCLWKDLPGLVKMIETGESNGGEVIVARDGVEHCYEVSMYQLAGGQAHTGGKVISLHDVTRRRNAEEALARSEERYRTMVNQMYDTYHEVDLRGNIDFSSESAVRNVGYEPGEVVGKNFRIFLLEEDIAAEIAACNQVFRTGIPQKSLVRRIRHRDGSTRYMEASIDLRKNERGEPTGFKIINRDVSERIQAEKLLEIQRSLAVSLSHETDLYPAMRLCLEAALRASGMDSGGIYLVDLESRAIDLVYASGLSTEFINASSHYSADSANASIVMAGKPLYTTFSELGTAGSVSQLYMREGLISLAIIPILSGGGVVACLNIASHSYERINQGTRWAVETIASQIGGAIQRIMAMEALSRSERKYRFLADNTRDIIWTLDMNLRTTYVSPSIEAALGFTPEERMKQDIAEQLTPPSLAEAADILAREQSLEEEGLADPGRIVILESEYFHKDGSTLWFENVVNGIRDESGKLTGFQGVSRNVVERRKAEEQVKQTRRNYETFFNSIDDLLFVLDESGNIVHVNGTVLSRLGFTAEDLFGRSVLMVHPPERREEAGFIIGEMLAGRADFCPVPVMTKAGQQIPVETKVTRGLWDGKPAIFGVTKDISALKFSEEKFSRIFQSSSALIVLSRCEDDCIIDVNGTFLNTLGYVREDVIGKTFAELRIYADGGRQGEIDEVLKLNGAVKNLEMAMRAKDGAMKDCLLSAETIYVGTDRCLLSILVDITDRRRLEEEREKVARLESVGQLAAGVAHDFNNILTAVLGNINLARLDAIPGSSLQGALERAEEASLRAKTITARLLTFSRGGAPVKKIAHVNDLLRNTANLALSGSNVKCLFSIPDDLWRAEIDESQVGQVLHNLVVNAQQAMPGSGNIELIATNMTLSKNQSLAEKLPLKPGDFIRIDVRDHGTGISAEDVGKIFDPFFTTTPGHSGLGLTAAFSIVRQHGGHISVETELGRGSTFHVYLPAFTRSAAPAQAGKAAARHESQARILVMDDEKTVREITGRMIRHAGYENVELSADGREALKLYKAALEAGEPFSLVILDLTVPGAMGGQETIGELLKVDPGVNAVVSSGYADDPVIAGYREYGFSGAIVKPFTLEDLRQVLRDVIG